MTPSIACPASLALAGSLLVGAITSSAPRLEPASAMRSARAAHTATTLRDGSVLVAGGFVEKGSASGAELYDLAADPGEKHDLAAERPEESSKLLDLLIEWRRVLRGQGFAAEVPEDEEHRKLLRSLGYVD